MKVRILYNDGLNRFKAGEIGEVIDNDYASKYDFKVDLGEAEEVLIGDTAPTKIRRIVYFYNFEVEILKENT